MTSTMETYPPARTSATVRTGASKVEINQSRKCRDWIPKVYLRNAFPSIWDWDSPAKSWQTRQSENGSEISGSASKMAPLLWIFARRIFKDGAGESGAIVADTLSSGIMRQASAS